MGSINGSYYADASTPASLATITQTMAQAESDRLGAALGIKQYRWANSAARTAQTGMATGDMGYQVDTGVTYRYNGAAWKGWESDWITYTTTLSTASGTFAIGTGGSASNVTKYRYEQGTVRVSFSFVLGTTGTMGSMPKFTLPFASVTPAHGYLTYASTGDIFDTSGSSILIGAVVVDVTSTTVVRVAYMNNIAGLIDYPAAGTPWIWAAGDAMQGTFTFDPA